MKVELKMNDKSIQAEISEGQLKELGLVEQLKKLGLLEERSRTGYERVKKDEMYYVINTKDDSMINVKEFKDETDEQYYNIGNYYNDKIIVENNARADRLLRKLRQWQALNDEPVNKRDLMQLIFTIGYDYKKDDAGNDAGLYAYSYHRPVSFGEIHFSTRDKVKEAINVFKDELTWYFTEYQQRLDETMQ